jgi:hypothetical protein
MYYVYVGWLGDKIMYIGKGKNDRDLHLNSGCSHVYEANRLHFLGGRLDVERIAENLEELDAFELETHLVHEAKPAWNKQAVGNSHKKSTATSEYLGVSFYKNKAVKPWRAWYKTSNKKHHIGYFNTELEAVLARDNYLKDNGIIGRINSPLA